MKFTKATVLVAASLALGGTALAQDQAAVSGEKQAGIRSLVPDLYGGVEVRHYTFRQMDGDEVVNDIPLLEARPRIGTTLFDDLVDTMFMWSIQKRPETTTVTKAWLVNVTEIKLLKGENGYIGPYAETYQANGASFGESYVGIYGEGKYDIPLAAGKLTFGGWTQDNVILRSAASAKDESNRVTPENRTGRAEFALNEQGDTTMEKRHPDLIALNGVNVKFSPAVLPAFSVGAEIEYDRQWEAKYAVLENGDLEQDGYTTSAATISKFILGYKLSDKVSLSNSLRHKTGGFYERGINANNENSLEGKNRWENRLVLNATLF